MNIRKILFIFAFFGYMFLSKFENKKKYAIRDKNRYYILLSYKEIKDLIKKYLILKTLKEGLN